MSSEPLLISFLTASFLQVNRVQAQSPTSAARRFNIFAKGNAASTSSETEGAIAVGGNRTTHQYRISFNPEHRVFYANNASIGRAVRGGVKLNDGRPTMKSHVKIGKWGSSDERYSDIANINVNANITIFKPTALKVQTVPASVGNSIQNSNFSDVTNILPLGDNIPICGTIFTPQADLIKENNGDLNDQATAKSFMHNRDEVHLQPFLPSIPEPSTLLPVTFTSFSAQEESSHFNLKWKVTKATDFSHFMVQRSPNATKIRQSPVSMMMSAREISVSQIRPSQEKMFLQKNNYRLQQVKSDKILDFSAIHNVEASLCGARLGTDL
jgi:hypothetical protein